MDIVPETQLAWSVLRTWKWTRVPSSSVSVEDDQAAIHVRTIQAIVDSEEWQGTEEYNIWTGKLIRAKVITPTGKEWLYRQNNGLIVRCNRAIYENGFN